VAPETLKMISKIKRAGANKMITVASLGRGKMTSRMVPVGAPALPRNKTCPKARASRMVPETLAKKAKGASLTSKKIKVAAVTRLDLENPMTTRNPMAESKAA
jgi:hypothetical protein